LSGRDQRRVPAPLHDDNFWRNFGHVSFKPIERAHSAKLDGVGLGGETWDVREIGDIIAIF